MAGDVLQVEGVVVEGYPDAKFKVEVSLPSKTGESQKHVIHAYVSGKMRQH